MLEIRLLGELEVVRDGQAVPLPASKKSRALLAYLAATARPHLRERLCELLWEGPDDPRAALRWSLTKLRPLTGSHLVTTRDHVEFRCEGAAIDIRRIGTPVNETTDLLEEQAALFRGGFLDGLDLPGCFRYQQWCIGERERIRQTHIAILTELTQRLGRNEAALRHARRRVMLDPFNDQAHGALISLLASLGLSHEAMGQYDSCRSIFERELGARPGPVVEDARRTIGKTPTPAPSAATFPQASPPAILFVGRSRELAALEPVNTVVFFSGEPGIGKSRLLEELRIRTAGSTLYGRAFAAEMIRPYGLWIDALGGFPNETDRTRLFEAVVQMLSGVALIAIDDLQWIDEASAALLHYVARTSTSRIVLAARSGELEDNPKAMRLIRELAREKRLRRFDLEPLTAEETIALARAVAAPEDVERVASESGGNPLFTIELGRAHRPGSLLQVIGERITQLEGSAREVVSWAAAVGRQFDAEIVGRATGMAAGEMLEALERLERCGIIRAAGDRYDFGHDLVREVAYQAISGPRRTLVHRHIARALHETHDSDGALAGEIVHHASLAGDHALAATAAVDAGNRCLRMFAYAEAVSVARRGLQLVESLSGNLRLETEMGLLNVLVMSRTPVREKVELTGRLASLTEAARSAGLPKIAALGAHLLACLYEESNRYLDAAGATIQSAELSQTADAATVALSMANSARCLLFLQRDVARAESLLGQASAIGIENAELDLGIGFLHAHHGRVAQAMPHLERAFELAARQQDHWREWIALWRMVIAALEQSDAALALQFCERLRPIATKMKGGSELVRSDVLEMLAHWLAGHSVDLEGALARLREVDSKSDLAWALTFVAQIEMKRGLVDDARLHAEEAVVAAEAVGRDSETAIARCILGLRTKASPDLTARARKFMKEATYGHTRSRAKL
ncbi:MAG TPA: BTAD domain-containing putative transcriptional regulator [Thermoanaerobaculia bacterium]|nr:BTAD domain-containing putative transcriptional regulator [Thermoanaerobaculia bacterium]